MSKAGKHRVRRTATARSASKPGRLLGRKRYDHSQVAEHLAPEVEIAVSDSLLDSRDVELREEMRYTDRGPVNFNYAFLASAHRLSAMNLVRGLDDTLFASVNSCLVTICHAPHTRDHAQNLLNEHNPLGHDSIVKSKRMNKCGSQQDPIRWQAQSLHEVSTQTHFFSPLCRPTCAKCKPRVALITSAVILGNLESCQQCREPHHLQCTYLCFSALLNSIFPRSLPCTASLNSAKSSVLSAFGDGFGPLFAPAAA